MPTGIVTGFILAKELQEEFTGETAAVNADTILGLTFAKFPREAQSVRFLVNGQIQRNEDAGVGADFIVNTATKKITWKGGTGPGTGTAEFALEAADILTVIYEAISA